MTTSEDERAAFERAGEWHARTSAERPEAVIVRQTFEARWPDLAGPDCHLSASFAFFDDGWRAALSTQERPRSAMGEGEVVSSDRASAERPEAAGADDVAEALRSGWAAAPKPFVVKHYSADERPTIKGNGFDGLEVGQDREEAEAFITFVNSAITATQRSRQGPDCRRCAREGGEKWPVRMYVCPQCGDKRCPKAEDHRSACAGAEGSATDSPAEPVRFEYAAGGAFACFVDGRNIEAVRAFVAALAQPVAAPEPLTAERSPEFLAWWHEKGRDVVPWSPQDIDAAEIGFEAGRALSTQPGTEK
jgi:hypothetical protein